ncbi:MAG: hypothetical protein RMJ98_01095 [Myxococcales bacterium]|nr:hypothetical protein [Polyangiaceae bacterium]MDW8247883.1 hypothetical protein [Myxococcales bacterium]
MDTRTPESLFMSLLLPLYPPEARADLARVRAVDANPGNNPSLPAQLAAIGEVFARLSREAFGEDLILDFSDASIHRLAHRITVERRNRWLRELGPDGLPLLLTVLLHGVAYLGECVVRNHGGVWKIRNPLWESLVSVRTRVGQGELAVLSWWLRALSDGEVGRGTLAERYRMHVEEPSREPLELLVIAAPDRRLPRLKQPRYDTLYKYLKAHLPELRDLGQDFPSPERFAELAFRWLDFLLLGEGRMLLMWGPTDHGLHLYWLDARGFRKGMYLPADGFPEPKVEGEGEKLRVMASVQGKVVVHEVLWWGP